MLGLTADQIEQYWTRGFVTVPRLLDTSEMAELTAECERLARLGASISSDPGQTTPRIDVHGRPVRNRLDPVVPFSPTLQKLLAQPRITQCLNDVFGQDALLFKDKLILRQPGTRGYRLHQDFAHYGWTGARPDELLALQIAIDPADESNGALQLYPGEHGALLPDEPSGKTRLRAKALRDARSELLQTQPGDALFFHSLTPHWSDTNRSDRYRRTLYLSYSAASAGDLYRIYYQERGELLT